MFPSIGCLSFFPLMISDEPDFTVIIDRKTNHPDSKQRDIFDLPQKDKQPYVIAIQALVVNVMS
jgi:hypothetical protein